MPSVTVSLTDRQKNYLDARVESGSYGNVSEVVREALRLLEARDQEQEARLRAAAQEANETGLSEPKQSTAQLKPTARERQSQRPSKKAS